MRLSREAAQWVTHERAQHGWSLRRAAEHAGLSTGTWHRIEKGEEVEYTSVVRVVVALGRPAEDADALLRGAPPAAGTHDDATVRAAVEAALTADPRLSPDGVRFVLGVYEHERSRTS